jgi:CBS domain-containing protein
VHDIVEFLRAHEPFTGLDEAGLERLAERTEVEFFAAGDVIFEQGAPELKHVRIVRRGAVELVDRGRVLDLLGEGEWFGHPSMLSGLPTGWAARAAEDTLCYLLAAEEVVPVLTDPKGLRFVARTLVARPRVGEPTERAEPSVAPDLPGKAIVTTEPVVCPPETPISEAARQMAERRTSCALVSLRDGELGIVTDYDIRTRVVAEELPLDAPISAAMTAPAVTAHADSLGTELLLTMVDQGVRHLPLRSSRGELVGVVTDRDLLAAEAHAPFVIRRAINEARDVEELRVAIARLKPAVVALHDAEVGPAQVGSIMAAVVDAAVRRLIEFELDESSLPSFSWLALGSFGRREPMPASDLDSGLVWDGEKPEPLIEFAGRVGEELERAGFRRDPHGATAAGTAFARSAEEWRAAIPYWMNHPGQVNVLIAVSLIADGRVVAGNGTGPDILGMLTGGRNHPRLLQLLKRLALAQRPPTGFMRDIVVEHEGSHVGRFDIKRGGLLPIVDIARYAAIAAGSPATSTPERLRAAGAAGVLAEERARTLEEAFNLFAALRLEHQVEQLRAADPPDDFVDPGSLNKLTRRYMREAFREVAAVQRQLTSGLVFE